MYWSTWDRQMVEVIGKSGECVCGACSHTPQQMLAVCLARQTEHEVPAGGLAYHWLSVNEMRWPAGCLMREGQQQCEASSRDARARAWCMHSLKLGRTTRCRHTVLT